MYSSQWDTQHLYGTFGMTELHVSGLCIELVSKDLRIFLHNLFLVTFSPASLHQHSLCQREVWGTGWKKPSSLLLLILLQKQQKWNTGFVAINETCAKTLKGRISPCQAVLCNVNAASVYIHISFRGQGFADGFTKNNAKDRKGKVLRERDSPLETPFTSNLSYFVLKLHSLPTETLLHSENTMDF